MGDLFVETFAPQIGTYTDVGTASKTITSGNMNITGNGAAFTVGNNYTRLAEVVWAGNNWYLNCRMSPTSSALNQVAACFGLKSINTVQAQNVYWGLYFCSPINQWSVVIFNTTGDGLLASAGTKLTATAGQWVNIQASFVEQTLTVIATNENTSASSTVSYTWAYTYPISIIKPNSGRIVVSAGTSAFNISGYTFGTNYLRGVRIGFYGDSITSGYVSAGQANRYQDQYALATGNTIETFAGAADRSTDLSNSVALALYTTFSPNKIFLLIGTNDVANGILLATTQANIDAIISAFQGAGSQVYIGCCIPRDGVSLTTLNTWILAKNGVNGVTAIDLFSPLEDPAHAGRLNPTYTSEPALSAIHPNAAGMTVIKNALVAAGL
jgi:lysophospholipase L1-like esterase